MQWIQKFGANAGLTAASLLLSLAALEGVSRLIFEPVDFLMPTLEADALLGHRVAPYSGGHDRWGFRNFSVPESADIVAIGDSMTYGINATVHDSWPSQLARITGKSVYNMSLGGYGPVQYARLLKSKALSLHPAVIIVAFYFGNDYLDTYNMTRDKRYQRIRAANSDGIQTEWSYEKPPFIQVGGNQKLFGTFRSFLSRNSILYRLVTQNSIFDFVRQYESKRRTDVLDGGRFVVTINKDDHFLKPGDLYPFMNLEDSRIDNASEFAQVSLETMKELAGARKTKLFVILIPTKESVLFDVVHPVLSEKDIKIYRTMVDAEQQLRRKLTDFLAQNEIPFVDVLPILRNVVANGQSIYPGHDGHPNATGYKHIAEVVNAALGRLAD